MHGYALFPCIQVVPWFPGFRREALIPCQHSRVAARLEMATGKSKAYKPLGSEGAIDCRKRRSTRLLATQPDMRLPSALHVAEALQPFCESSDLAGLATRALQSEQANTFDASVEATAISLAHPLAKSATSRSAPESSARRRQPVWAWVALGVLKTDQSVHHGSFVVGPSMGVGRDRFEITLKLEPAGWRVAMFKVGKNVIEF